MHVKRIEVVTLPGLVSLSVASRKKLNSFFHFSVLRRDFPEKNLTFVSGGGKRCIVFIPSVFFFLFRRKFYQTSDTIKYIVSAERKDEHRTNTYLDFQIY